MDRDPHSRRQRVINGSGRNNSISGGTRESRKSRVGPNSDDHSYRGFGSSMSTVPHPRYHRLSAGANSKRQRANPSRRLQQFTQGGRPHSEAYGRRNEPHWQQRGPPSDPFGPTRGRSRHGRSQTTSHDSGRHSGPRYSGGGSGKSSGSNGSSRSGRRGGKSRSHRSRRQRKASAKRKRSRTMVKKTTIGMRRAVTPPVPSSTLMSAAPETSSSSMGLGKRRRDGDGSSSTMAMSTFDSIAPRLEIDTVLGCPSLPCSVQVIRPDERPTADLSRRVRKTMDQTTLSLNGLTTTTPSSSVMSSDLGFFRPPTTPRLSDSPTIGIDAGRTDTLQISNMNGKRMRNTDVETSAVFSSPPPRRRTDQHRSSVTVTPPKPQPIRLAERSTIDRTSNKTLSPLETTDFQSNRSRTMTPILGDTPVSSQHHSYQYRSISHQSLLPSALDDTHSSLPAAHMEYGRSYIAHTHGAPVRGSHSLVGSIESTITRDVSANVSHTHGPSNSSSSAGGVYLGASSSHRTAMIPVATRSGSSSTSAVSSSSGGTSISVGGIPFRPSEQPFLGYTLVPNAGRASAPNQSGTTRSGSTIPRAAGFHHGRRPEAQHSRQPHATQAQPHPRHHHPHHHSHHPHRRTSVRRMAGSHPAAFVTPGGNLKPLAQQKKWMGRARVSLWDFSPVPRIGQSGRMSGSHSHLLGESADMRSAPMRMHDTGVDQVIPGVSRTEREFDEVARVHWLNWRGSAVLGDFGQCDLLLSWEPGTMLTSVEIKCGQLVKYHYVSVPLFRGKMVRKPEYYRSSDSLVPPTSFIWVFGNVIVQRDSKSTLFPASKLLFQLGNHDKMSVSRVVGSNENVGDTGQIRNNVTGIHCLKIDFDSLEKYGGFRDFFSQICFSFDARHAFSDAMASISPSVVNETRYLGVDRLYAEMYAPPPNLDDDMPVYKRFEHVRYIPHSFGPLSTVYLDDTLLSQMVSVYESTLLTPPELFQCKAALALLIDRIVRDGSRVARFKESAEWIERVKRTKGTCITVGSAVPRAPTRSASQSVVRSDDPVIRFGPVSVEDDPALMEHGPASEFAALALESERHRQSSVPHLFSGMRSLELVGSIAMGLDVRSSDVDTCLSIFTEAEFVRLSEVEKRAVIERYLNELAETIKSIPLLKPINELRPSTLKSNPMYGRSEAADEIEECKVREIHHHSRVSREESDESFEVDEKAVELGSENVAVPSPAAKKPPVSAPLTVTIPLSVLNDEEEWKPQGLASEQLNDDYLLSQAEERKAPMEDDRDEVSGYAPMVDDSDNTYHLSVKVFGSAKVPIIKIKDPFTNVELDISTIDNVSSVRFIRELVESGQGYFKGISSNRVPPFVASIKYWAQCRRINSSFERYMNSFGFVMMCLKYLQMLAPRMIDIRKPIFRSALIAEASEVNSEDTMYRARSSGNHGSSSSLRNSENPGRRQYVCSEIVAKSEAGSNSMRLSELVFGFFEWASRLDRENFSIDVTELGLRFKDESQLPEHRCAPLLIIDPLDSGNNIARNAATHKTWEIWEEFQRASSLLRNGNSWFKVCEPRRHGGAPMGSGVAMAAMAGASRTNSNSSSSSSLSTMYGMGSVRSGLVGYPD